LGVISNFSYFCQKKENLKSINFNFINNFIDILFVLTKSISQLITALTDLFVSDYLYFIKRFRLTYSFQSLFLSKTLMLSYSIKLLQSFVSIYKIFKCSIWIEREAYDMFGIKFINNWDLRKILTDYTFFGFPLRKDFPLSGYVEVFYDEKRKSTFETFIELMQELRFFVSPSSIEFWDLRQ